MKGKRLPLTRQYNLKNIRTLLTQGFSSEELRQLCFDEPDFRPVYDQLSLDSGKTEIVSRILEYAQTKLLIDKLLALAQAYNSARFESHQPYYDDMDSSATSGSLPTEPQKTPARNGGDALPRQANVHAAPDLKKADSTTQVTESSPSSNILNRLRDKLRDSAWGGIAVIVAILTLCVTMIGVAWSIYTFVIQTPEPASNETTVLDTPTLIPTSTDEAGAGSTPTSSPPPTRPPASPTVPDSSLPTYSGNLAIPLISGFSSKVYLTGFDGLGINGPNPISREAQQPMFSWDGRSVLVKATIEGKSGIHKLTASGFNPELSIERSSAEWPVLSPDGQTIMFSETTLDYRLHVIKPDQTVEEVHVDDSPVSTRNLLWSEDNRLVFHGCATWLNEPDMCGTWVTNVNNLNPQRLVENNEAYPMSVRAGHLVYMIQEGGDWEVFIVPLAGGPAANLTNNDVDDGLPVISPNGDGIAYISRDDEGWAVWTMTLDGQNKKPAFKIDAARGTIDTSEWINERMSWRR
jgi:hypothetical protein